MGIKSSWVSSNQHPPPRHKYGPALLAWEEAPKLNICWVVCLSLICSPSHPSSYCQCHFHKGRPPCCFFYPSVAPGFFLEKNNPFCHRVNTGPSIQRNVHGFPGSRPLCMDYDPEGKARLGGHLRICHFRSLSNGSTFLGLLILAHPPCIFLRRVLGNPVATPLQGFSALLCCYMESV